MASSAALGRAPPRTRINASAISFLVRPPVTACVFISLRSAAAVVVFVDEGMRFMILQRITLTAA